MVASLTSVRTRLEIVVMSREDERTMERNATTSKIPSGHRVATARTFRMMYRNTERILCIWFRILTSR